MAVTLKHCAGGAVVVRAPRPVDVLIAGLTTTIAEQRQYCIELEVIAASYRLLAQRAIAALHEAMLERDLLRGQRTLDRRQARRVEAA